jgi:O-antigen/teichoic acid export membrane protein
MGAEMLGAISFIMGTASLFAMFTDLGFYQAHLKRVAEGRNIEECLGAMILIAFILNGAAMGVSMLYLKLEQGLFFDSWAQQIAFIVLVGQYFLNNLSQVFLTTLNAKLQIAKWVTASLLAKMVQLAGVAFVSLSVRELISLSFAYFLGSVALLISAIYLLRPVVKWPSVELLKSYISYAKPFIVLNPVSLLTERLDVIAIKMGSGLAEVGYYTVARSLYDALKSISSAAMQVFFPQVTEDFAKGRKDLVQSRLFRIERQLLLMVTPLVTLVALFAGPIVVTIFGNEFAGSSKILIIFCGVTWLVTLSRPYSNILYAAEKHYLLIKSSLAAFLVYILILAGTVMSSVLNLPWGGLGGAGAALAVGSLWIAPLPFIIRWVKCYTAIGFYWPMWKFLVAAGELTLPVWITPGFWLKVTIGVVMGLLVYLGTLSLLRILCKEDLQSLLDLLNPKAMVTYVLKEIQMR